MTLQYRMASRHLWNAYCTQFGNSSVNLFMEPIHDNFLSFFLSFVLYSILHVYILCWVFLAMLPLITIERPWNLYLHFKIHLHSLCFIELCGSFNTPKIQRFFYFNENNVCLVIKTSQFFCKTYCI
jgi:hypothetical protein